MRLSEGLIANKQNHQGHMIQTRRQEAVPGKMMYPRLFRTTLVPRGSRRVKFKLNYGKKSTLERGRVSDPCLALLKAHGTRVDWSSL